MGHPSLMVADVEGQARLRCVDCDLVAVADAAIEDLSGERILDQALDGALERTGSVGAIVAGFEDGLARGRRQVDGDLAIGQQLLQVSEAEIDDVRELLFAEWMEDDYIVDTVEKLGAEVLAQYSH